MKSNLAHVYIENDTIFSVILNKVDIGLNNTNSYYKLQLLESDETNPRQ